tara:strand:+ start:405 stop:701 length:297 start_codon:yes stop_codon:yes gene_type:complete
MTRYVNLINGIEIPMTEAEISERKLKVDEWKNNNTPFSLAMETLRMKRNSLLAETDYLALLDNTLTDSMNTYRQNLRDLTNGLSTVEDVNNVTWPTKP